MILGIDFGGTRTRAGLFARTEDGLTLLARDEIASQVAEPQPVVIDRLIALARRVAGDQPIEGIGMAAPGPLNPQRGLIHHAHTLPGWRDVPLAGLVSAAFGGVATVMHNDANLAALAEYERGAGIGCNPLIYLTISTGIGGGVIMDGRLFGGFSGLASEPGHQLVPAPGGGLTRLEALASGTGIGRLAQYRLHTTDQPSTLRDHTRADVDGRRVGMAALAGDALARSVIDEAGTALGIGLVNLLHLFSPQAIVIGGSAAQLGDLLLKPARAVIADHLLDPLFLPHDLIRAAALGDDVCLIGAAYYALRVAVTVA